MPVKPITPRAGLLQLAKLVAGDLRRGQMSSSLRTVGPALAESPDALPAVLDLLLSEVGKKRPNDSMCDAFLFMIGQALAEARMALEGDAYGPAAEIVAEVRQRLATAAETGRLPLRVMMALAQLFAAAKLDLGDDLRALTATLSEQAAAQSPALGPEDIAAHYAHNLDCAGDA